VTQATIHLGKHDHLVVKGCSIKVGPTYLGRQVGR